MIVNGKLPESRHGKSKGINTKMNNKEKELEIFTFDQIKDEFIGEVGTVKRSLYEQQLQIEILGDLQFIMSWRFQFSIFEKHGL